jgi:predicted DNA-binding transcriptional regulator AlpA
LSPADERLGINEASAITGLSKRTLYGYRCANTGPVSWMVGNKLVYLRSDIESWMENRKQATARGTGLS